MTVTRVSRGTDLLQRRGDAENPEENFFEPASESCMKIQRNIGVNDARENTYVLTRVVPPEFRSLKGDYEGAWPSFFDAVGMRRSPINNTEAKKLSVRRRVLWQTRKW